MIIDGIKKLSNSFQLRQRAFFVDPYQAARARDICRQNSCQSTYHPLAGQETSPKTVPVALKTGSLAGWYLRYRTP